jgi:hypothetical protein
LRAAVPKLRAAVLRLEFFGPVRSADPSCDPSFFTMSLPQSSGEWSQSKKTVASRWYPFVSVLVLATVAAVLVISHGASTATELGQVYQYQPSLMDEGSITMDPASTEDAAKEFFRMNEASTQTDEDVPDAGPGHILGGWTHPELVNTPDPSELESFQDPSSEHSGVYDALDYTRTPGAVDTVENSRTTIAALQDQIAASHNEAEEAKRVYEAEKAKSKQLQSEYVKYVRTMQEARQKYGARADANSAQGGLNMWAANARAPDFDNQQADLSQPQQAGNQFVIDENTEDPAAVYRKQFYSQTSPDQPTLSQVQFAFYKNFSLLCFDVAHPSSLVFSRFLLTELLSQSQNAASAPVAERATRQSLVSFDAMPQVEDEAQRRNTVLAAEEQALRDRSVKVQLAQDVARLQLARQRLAAVIHRPSALKVCGDTRGCQRNKLFPRASSSCALIAVV